MEPEHKERASLPDPLERVRAVLVRPRSGGNIGASARAVKNMGLGGLCLVSPDEYRRSEAKMFAAHASDVLEGMETFDTIEEAVSGFRIVLGTSRRVRSGRLRIMTPREAAGHVLSHLGEGTASILFGPEDNGLTSEELASCHGVIAIPSHEAQPSLNLSQAVMVVAYELRVGMEGLPEVRSFGAATPWEMEEVLGQISAVLRCSGFFLRNPEERALLHLREILSRGMTTSQDARIVRGMFRRIAWALGMERDKGKT